MGWATHLIERLKQGETVTFRPRGHSMTGKVDNGDLCTVAPMKPGDTIAKGDIVLCEVGRAQYLHLVKAVNETQCLIGNNRGGVNGCPQRGLILFDADGKRRGGYSAQCNVIEAITRSFRERLFPWADVVQLPSVFRAVERGEFL